MKLSKEEMEDVWEMIPKLRKKYDSITSLLEEIDSQMTEFFVIIEDLNYYSKRQKSP